jgi:hypothetical protein
MNELEIFINSEQPTTCSKCGNRTEIIKDEITFQQHKCLTIKCSFEFTLEFDD